MNEVTAFVLAGGRSSRMGEDKAFLELDGKTLLARMLELASSVAPEVSVVGQKEKFAAYGPVVEDLFPDRGPLAGIHAALGASQTELNLVLAVDMPFLTTSLLQHLLDVARASGSVVTVPRVSGRLQTLCAVYRREFAAWAEDSLGAGRNKIDPLFALVPSRIVEEEELAALDFPARMFDNLNTRQDWERARNSTQPHG
jgi:molybdopterin-guanine dinucleotide biosynthesis protein A